jgi:hypothetical protein
MSFSKIKKDFGRGSKKSDLVHGDHFLKYLFAKMGRVKGGNYKKRFWDILECRMEKLKRRNGEDLIVDLYYNTNTKDGEKMKPC